MTNDHHLNDFQHLDLELTSLDHVYDLGWKFEDRITSLVLYVSCTSTDDGGKTADGTLHYALERDKWDRHFEASDVDRARMMDLALKVIPDDLASVEKGAPPDWYRGSHEASIGEGLRFL
jgi:hypothetical protein